MGPTVFIATLRKGKAGPAYFLRGPDRFLQDECRSAIAASLAPEAREWCLAEIEFEPGRLARELDGASQMPMLGGHSFLVFSDPEDFKRASDAEYEALDAYLERPSPFATVVFIASEPDRRRRFIQLLEKKAQVVEMRPLVAREAAEWLRDYLSKRGVEIAPDLAEEIAVKFEVSPDSRGESHKAGVNLLWLRTEMEKLLTGKPGGQRIERDDLDLLVVFREEHEIGKLLAAIAERKFPEALAQLRALLASKEPETLILWCIGDLIRQTLKAGVQPQFGRRLSPYGGERGGWGRFANPFSAHEIAPRALGSYSRQELSQALRAVRRADLGIKSSWKDSKILLEFLLWQIIVGKAAETLEYIGETLPAETADA
ncbi:MAG: DNA polymerase III subunit delta [Acidobacteriia bacterium]|nr:DNA polymerase III subunit delta [Terriglobia bacterium]